MSSIKAKLLCIIVPLLMSGCAANFYKAVQSGEVPDIFSDSVKTDIYAGFMIVPVTVHGEEYRFIFDSGAPLSISYELQDLFDFKTIDKIKITDTDDNSKEMEYVSLDSLILNNTLFSNQTALVLDFTKNPKLSCLNVDGIIGSNLMRHCNWTINFPDSSIHFYTASPSDSAAYEVPFKVDQQYNIYAPVNINGDTSLHIEIDYGFNGDLSMLEDDYKRLVEDAVLDEGLIEYGYNRSGILGKEVAIKEKRNVVDSLFIGDALFKNAVLNSSTYSLIGTGLLSRYIVSIDWSYRKLYFTPSGLDESHEKTFGFSIGYSQPQGLYVQSVIQNSAAERMGISPKMRIYRVNNIDFTGDNFCDIITMMKYDSDVLYVEVEFENTRKVITLEKDTSQ